MSLDNNSILISSAQNENIDSPITWVIFLAPDPHIYDRLARALIAAKGQIRKSNLGLTLTCAHDTDWKQIVQTAAASLSEPERHAIRLAPLSAATRTWTARKIFAGRRLDEFIAELSSAWLVDVLDRGVLSVQFQPLIQQPPGRLHGYECVLQAADEFGKKIAPDQMRDAAVKLDLLSTLERRCRLTAVKRAAEAGVKNARIFISFTPEAIYRPQTCFREAMDAVEAAGIPPAQVVFQAMNSEQKSDRKHLREIVQYCRSRNYKIALDDVGTGSATLLAMTELRPDYLKLDSALLRRAMQLQSETTGIKGLAEAARQHGVMMIAKGINTEQELQFSYNLGIRITQGNIHAKKKDEIPTSDQMQQIVRDAREAYTPRAAKRSSSNVSRWDIAGLYANLSHLAKSTPGATVSTSTEAPA